jgi:hypothetical protein
MPQPGCLVTRRGIAAPPFGRETALPERTLRESSEKADLQLRTPAPIRTKSGSTSEVLRRSARTEPWASINSMSSAIATASRTTLHREVHVVMVIMPDPRLAFHEANVHAAPLRDSLLHCPREVQTDGSLR